MTGREAYDIFKAIVDNYTDEYVSEIDFSRLFNTAQKLLLDKELLPFENPERRTANTPPRVSIENSQKVLEDWNQVVIYDASVPISAGSVTLSLLEAAFPDSVKRDEVGVIATEKPKIRHIMSLRVSTDGTTYVGARFRRHNDRIVVENDPFRKPTTTYPNYFVANNTWRVEPVDFIQAYATVVREPVFMWFESNGSGNNVDPELSDTTCIRIIHLAAELSAISHRDNALAGNLEQIRHVAT